MESEKREQPNWIKKIILLGLNKKKESSEKDSMDNTHGQDNPD